MTRYFESMKRKLAKHLIGCFFFGFLFIFSYWVGLPTDFNADHLTINLRGAEASSYLDLIQRVLDPRTPAWFYPTDRHMEFLRPLQFLGMKLCLDLFQSSLVPAHLVAAVGSGLLSVAFFVLIFHWTQSLLFAWLGVLLYASFPSNYNMLTSTFSFDFQYFISCLSLTALLTFSRLTFGHFKKGFAFAGAVLLWVASIWLAIKLKSSEKILPIICLAFLLWRLPFLRNHLKGWRLAVLVLALLGMSILIVPLSPPSAVSPDQSEPAVSKDKITFSFHWKNMLARTFYVPGGEFPFFTLWRHELPRSFTENYGFFLGWFFWMSLIMTPILLTRRRCDEAKEHDFWMILIWFLATIGGFGNGLSVYDTRFLNFAYVPSVLLLFLMAHFFLRRWTPGGIQKRFFQVVLAAAVLYTALPNFGKYTKLSLHGGGMQHSLVQTETDIFKVAYGREPQGWELYQRHHDLETERIAVDWYELPPDWRRGLDAKLDLSGTVYFFARFADSPRLQELKEAGYAVELWKSYDFVDAKPAIFRIAKVIRGLKKAIRGRAKKYEILVYRIEAPTPPRLP